MERPLAIVTGGGRGYGTVVARHLADAGMNVAVLGRDAEAVSAVARDISGVPVIADILDRAALAAGIADVAERHGTPVVLVNNAGVGG